MKFKTRIRVTFITIIVLPLALTSLAFCLIGLCLMNTQKGLSYEQINYSAMSENIKEIVENSDKVYGVLLEQIKENPRKLEDREYLEQVSSQIGRKSTYIIVRKGDELYYAGNPAAAEKIFSELPDYGEGDFAEGSGIYYDEYEKYVKQIDFIFSDGSEGSVFVIAKARYVCGNFRDYDIYESGVDPVDSQGCV